MHHASDPVRTVERLDARGKRVKFRRGAGVAYSVQVCDKCTELGATSAALKRCPNFLCCAHGDVCPCTQHHSSRVMRLKVLRKRRREPSCHHQPAPAPCGDYEEHIEHIAVPDEFIPRGQKRARTYAHCLRSSNAIKEIVAGQVYLFPHYDDARGRLDNTRFVHAERIWLRTSNDQFGEAVLLDCECPAATIFKSMLLMTRGRVGEFSRTALSRKDFDRTVAEHKHCAHHGAFQDVAANEDEAPVPMDIRNVGYRMDTLGRRQVYSVPSKSNVFYRGVVHDGSRSASGWRCMTCKRSHCTHIQWASDNRIIEHRSRGAPHEVTRPDRVYRPIPPPDQPTALVTDALRRRSDPHFPEGFQLAYDAKKFESCVCTNSGGDSGDNISVTVVDGSGDSENGTKGSSGFDIGTSDGTSSDDARDTRPCTCGYRCPHGHEWGDQLFAESKKAKIFHLNCVASVELRYYSCSDATCSARLFYDGREDAIFPYSADTYVSYEVCAQAHDRLTTTETTTTSLTRGKTFDFDFASGGTAKFLSTPTFQKVVRSYALSLDKAQTPPESRRRPTSNTLSR